MVYDIMNDGQRKFYEENLECDFSFAIPNLARFRVNAFVQNRGAAAVMRTIPSKILSLDDLKAPKIFKELADQPRKTRGQRYAAGVDPHQGKLLRLTMALHDLVGDAGNRAAHLILVYEDLPGLARHGHARRRPNAAG